MIAIEQLDSRAQRVPANLTRQLANSAMGRPDVIALWFGEPDVVTPDFIRKAATESLNCGETFYTESLGRMFLREAISKYASNLYGQPVNIDRLAVTVSGGNALNLAFQCLLEQGDKVVTTRPAFPNLLSIPALQGAQIQTVPLRHSSSGWQVDTAELLDAAQGAKVLLINSPNNPTGWVMPAEQMQAIADSCRHTGTWIVSDEVYARLCYDRPAAPSFLQATDAEDRLIVVNSFSKSWAMTGWRLGWLTVPPSLLPTVERIMEFSVSCAPAFAQRAATAALRDGEDFIRQQNVRYQDNLQMVQHCFATLDRVEFPAPSATFYAYFRVSGVTDNMGVARQFIDEAKVGLAPGVAFDSEAHDWFRMCFAVAPDRLNEALKRLETFLA